MSIIIWADANVMWLLKGLKCNNLYHQTTILFFFKGPENPEAKYFQKLKDSEKTLI